MARDTSQLWDCFEQLKYQTKHPELCHTETSGESRPEGQCYTTSYHGSVTIPSIRMFRSISLSTCIWPPGSPRPAQLCWLFSDCSWKNVFTIIVPFNELWHFHPILDINHEQSPQDHHVCWLEWEKCVLGDYLFDCIILVLTLYCFPHIISH